MSLSRPEDGAVWGDRLNQLSWEGVGSVTKTIPRASVPFRKRRDLDRACTGETPR